MKLLQLISLFAILGSGNTISPAATDIANSSDNHHLRRKKRRKIDDAIHILMSLRKDKTAPSQDPSASSAEEAAVDGVGSAEEADARKKRPFGCRFCEYKAATARNVIRHERTHTGEKPYGCRHCDYKAATASNVTVHERTHTGEKPFGCQYCEYRAATASHITEHERTHTGEKPYECKHCGYRAAQASNVTRHERSKHSSDKPTAGAGAGATADV